MIPVTEANLARIPKALEGELRGGSGLEGAGKGRLWRKCSRKGVDRGKEAHYPLEKPAGRTLSRPTNA